MSLKEYTGSSPSGVLRHVSKSESQIANAGISNADIYVNAKNVPKEVMLGFIQNGPLKDIPIQGTIKSIYIQTVDGWILVS